MQQSQLLIFVVLIAAMWLLMIRPQQKRVRQHQQLVRTLQEGDEVVTIGGIYGTIARMDDESLWLDVGSGVIRFSRQAISRRISPEQPDLSTDEPEIDAG